MSHPRHRSAPVKIVQLFGDLLGTYGDGGNALVLQRRAEWRGIDVKRIDVTALDPIPDDGDIYLIGGGEDGPQARAAKLLVDSGALTRAVQRGAAVLAVCAGFQIMGHSFLGPDGASVDGLGLLDVTTGRADGPRIVGEVLVDTTGGLGVGRMTGYENHAGVTRLGPDAMPLGTVMSPRSDGASRQDRHEGAFRERIVGTYLHGPVLARNPVLADRLIAWALDADSGHLASLDDHAIEDLRSERFAAAMTPAAKAQGFAGLRDRLRRSLGH